MAKSNVQQLKDWFDGLPPREQEKVLEFLYGDAYVRMNLQEGVYCGPAPGVVSQGSYVQKGLYSGPAPIAPAACPHCGRPY